MADGTRLAVDLWTWNEHERRPAIVWFTRYWRRSTGAEAVSETFKDAISYFTGVGYTFLVVDVRGTGASFGQRPTEWARAEIDDYGVVIDWVANQPWSNGAVATLGTSYSGNAAELATLTSGAPLRATVPRFTDFTEYLHAFRPGGLVNTVISDTWMTLTRALDRNNDPAVPELAGTLQPGESVCPVDGDNGTLLAQAVAEHRVSGDVCQTLEALRYADDPFTSDETGTTLEDVSPSTLWPAIDARQVPSMHWASWYDGGTADGVITRFMTYRTPMVGVIGAWNHGASTNANPFGARDTAPPEPSRAAQYAAIDTFLRPLMADRPGASPERVLEYFTVGADVWRSTECWPPAGHMPWVLQLTEGNGLTPEPPVVEGADRYSVHPSATTGTKNRWHTQLSAPLDYGDRRLEDEGLLVYDSEPLESDLEFTGSPVAHLHVSVDGSDGAIFTYFESVAPDGTVTLLSDACARLSLAGSERDSATYPGPTPTFTRATRRLMVPGEPTLIRITLHALSAVVSKGHRLRLAVAGADVDTFSADQLSTLITIHRSPRHPSYLSLPRIHDVRGDAEATTWD
ncbi:CocE/NonD family hydrolase [Amycolatopsis sp. K13G38]|uniref:CocE/NonD family hydrolase n=1 Tax=Amycolatopsis acididurans TaxID=2724524 RepID=A0ABX1JEN6_9PSEU|nr:CocE/NonD family hydrolase [Amycolatopsis acididurans]NKQ58203.1 CocE/NonD family hydrolase [Amycolatopsis acididurans]